MTSKRKAAQATAAASSPSASSTAPPPTKKARLAVAGGAAQASKGRKSGEASRPTPSSAAGPSTLTEPNPSTTASPTSRPRRTKDKAAQASRPKKRKLAPPKPPGAGLPSGAAVTGPTGKIKGRDVVMISRRAELGSYMRKCKALLVDEGLQSITLHALSASIPHLFLLLHSLLAILPFPRAQVHHSITTSSVKVTDELIPDDEEAPITLGERWCSAVEVVISIGDRREGGEAAATKSAAKKTRRKKRGKGKGAATVAQEVAAETADVVMAPMSASTAPAVAYEDEDDEMEAMNG